MLQTIELTNFKCFTRYDLTLGALTLLTGYNGAGKSSSLQPLLLMAQALRDSPRSTALSLNGPLVHLGSAGDVVAEGGTGSVNLGFADSRGDAASWTFDHDRLLNRGELRLSSSVFSFAASAPPAWAPEGDLNDLLRIMRDTIFLGATRGPHGEAQPFPDNPALVRGDVGAEGQWASYWYIRLADDEVPSDRRHPSEERTTVRGQVDAWMSDLFPEARVNAEQLAGVSLAKTSFALGRANDWRRPANVGYGLSYAFPIVVALLCADLGQIVIVDSPEAHLHPRAQSMMGRMLALFAAAGVQVVVESHSDHLLSGVRLAIRAGALSPDQVAVHFFGHRAEEGEKAHRRITIAADGSISDWPEGFFDQAMTDLIGLS